MHSSLVRRPPRRKLCSPILGPLLAMVFLLVSSSPAVAAATATATASPLTGAYGVPLLSPFQFAPGSGPAVDPTTVASYALYVVQATFTAKAVTFTSTIAQSAVTGAGTLTVPQLVIGPGPADSRNAQAPGCKGDCHLSLVPHDGGWALDEFDGLRLVGSAGPAHVKEIPGLIDVTVSIPGLRPWARALLRGARTDVQAGFSLTTPQSRENPEIYLSMPYAIASLRGPIQHRTVVGPGQGRLQQSGSLTDIPCTANAPTSFAYDSATRIERIRFTHAVRSGVVAEAGGPDSVLHLDQWRAIVADTVSNAKGVVVAQAERVDATPLPTTAVAGGSRAAKVDGKEITLTLDGTGGRALVARDGGVTAAVIIPEQAGDCVYAFPIEALSSFSVTPVQHEPFVFGGSAWYAIGAVLLGVGLTLAVRRPARRKRPQHLRSG
jgi:hypothetical protein